jgi:cyclopropane-fatty-acyl-phospholipid synthase
MTLTDPSNPRRQGNPVGNGSLVGNWPGLAKVPAGPHASIASAITRRIFAMATRRLGVRVVRPTEATHPTRTSAAFATPLIELPTIELHRPDAFFARVGSHGLIGFGESYMVGDWDSPDLDLLLTVLARDLTTLVPAWMQKLRKTYVARHPRWHRNSTDNTRNNIAHHYDLSNELFAAFLDETLSYSSALFDTETVKEESRSRANPPGIPERDELADAQGTKIERLLDSTGVGIGTTVLEIGTGWGELAIRAARRGAIVRSITLSSEQRNLALRRVAEAGFADLVTIDLLDYRNVAGTYDVVLSVEMIEAVGHEFLPSYFATIDRVLDVDGRAGIQAITMAHERVLTTLGTYTWINKYIFPGGFIPSIRLIEDVLAEHTSLRLTERLEFGAHYAETLRLWDEAFQATDTGALGFDATFDRMWHFYLTYCRAGFATGYLDVQQLLITR